MGQNPSTARDRDAGFMLPIALLLTVVLGGVVVGIAGYTTTSLRYGRTIQARTDRLAASDAGMRIALERLRTKSVSCTNTSTTIYTATIDSKPVTVNCSRTALLASEADQFALVVTAEGVPAGTPSWIAQGQNVATQARVIGGNVYLAVPPATLDKPVSITDGDLWYQANGACTDPTFGNLTFTPADERGYNCTTSTWQSIFPMPALPAVGTPQPANGKTNPQGCTVFQPGSYSRPPVIGAGTQNFFQPGTYYFNFDGAIDIKNAMVIGGVTRGVGLGSSYVAKTLASFTSDWCASAIDSAKKGPAPNTGVTWIFGGNSRIAVDGNGQIELFAPPTPPRSKIMVPSVVALQTAVGSYAASTLGASAAVSQLIDLQEGSNNGAVIHGGVWAPASAIRIGNIAQSANGQFMGGLIIGMLNMQSAANVGNFNLAVETQPAQRKVLVTSTADVSTTIKVVAIVRAATGTMAINSWRIQ